MPIYNRLEKGNVPVQLWAPIHEVESQALDQLTNISRLPFVFKHVAAMPDVHMGKGATVGSVIASKEMVIPAAVGVDIGCGMAALKTNINKDQLSEKLPLLRKRIEDRIPLGPDCNETITATAENWKGWRKWKNLHLNRDARDDTRLWKKAQSQLGSLGGGNHFIEMCLDEHDNVWLMLHSGSRNIGKVIAEYHMNKAKDLLRLSETKIPDLDLAYFLDHQDEFHQYWHDLKWAQDFALENRKEMIRSILEILRKLFAKKIKLKVLEEVHCHHNYVAEEVHFDQKLYVTRKGAVNAEKDQLGIIPGSMGAKSYIVRGKGNVESFCSCSHGAGRLMSRSKAKKMFTVEDLKAQTQGVECRKDSRVLDEIPGAYKDIDQVMERQKDLVEIVATLKQVLCVKG
ncbi:RtcB family protein [Pseudobacteriovorax antillogorgiicola]|uniref:3'-phosphate/5'-hydroxy nucleic acid ligase n=1 Tax=Pseudobacteriovorax antillogorgiicola TaxID=1513793 RepID=A0A1Y6CKU6_9BACT|nr:RtcB family protein [Pseudobacteriovorax antillogorgiicola]TCS46183.1 tRNA-splicing ligase RtcB [Pseudobacteriovorax antillogorgiicola]SMF70055.1 tRNA-splicing ligase RtcB [Pseudobacteriovorax antillogorgiicola]